MNKNINREVLHQRWIHSHEEDTEREVVFRPVNYRFPPSRGRKSIELKPDGSLLETRIGPTDRLQEFQGAWKLEGDDTLVLYTKSPSESRRVMQILSVDKKRLVIRK